MKGRSTLSGSALDPEGFETSAMRTGSTSIRVMTAYMVASAPGSRGRAEIAYCAGMSSAGNYRHLQLLMIHHATSTIIHERK